MEQLRQLLRLPEPLSDHRSADSKEDGVGLLRKESIDDDSAYDSGKRNLGINRRWGFWVSMCLIGVVIFCVYPVFPHPSPEASMRKQSKQLDPSTQQDHHFYIITPVAKSDVDLCKTTLSNAVLDYPSQSMIWYNSTTNRGAAAKNTKLKSILRFLKRQADRSADDIVLLLDGPGPWFQLRPEVLLRRYWRMTAEANRLLASKYPKEARDKHRIRQKVYFSAQTECPPHLSHDSECAAMPEVSSAPGPEREAGHHRYLNPSVAMGALKDIKALYQHAVARSAQVDEHSIFNQLFADQELRRAITLNAHDGERDLERQVDLGIGLDYDGELFLPTLLTDTRTAELEWIIHNDTEINHDIADSMGPFWTVSGRYGLPDIGWGSVPLLTDPHTGAIPAVIGHPSSATSNLQVEWWNKTWFTPYIRSLFDASVMLPEVPVAGLVDDEGIEHRFWKNSARNDGVRNKDNEFTPWDELCPGDEIAEEVFRDGKGPWVNPFP